MNRNAQAIALGVCIAFALAACGGPANEEVTLTAGITGCRTSDEAKRDKELSEGHDMGAWLDYYKHSSCEASKPGTKIIIEDRGLFETRYHVEGHGQVLITRDRINAS
jgi:hypothetical protein